MREFLIVGLGLMVFGVILAAGVLQFPQLTFCLGFWALGYCVGDLINLTWLLGAAVFAVGLLLLAVFGRRRR